MGAWDDGSGQGENPPSTRQPPRGLDIRLGAEGGHKVRPALAAPQALVAAAMDGGVETDSLKLGPIWIDRCEVHTPRGRCDRQPFFEEALIKAILENEGCADADSIVQRTEGVGVGGPGRARGCGPGADCWGCGVVGCSGKPAGGP